MVGALTIAFDTTIVGGLALPWVLLIIHLFFFEGENRLGKVLGWVKGQQQQAVAGVLLFALTYTLGSVVSRIARDFFNDDDLYVQIDGRLLRVAMTEDRIIASVYCDSNDSNLLAFGPENPAITAKISAFQCEIAAGDDCARTLKWWERHKYTNEDDNLVETAKNVFSLQENALLLKGQDATLRLRQLHDQIMVLRGAGFNAVVGFSLCLFAYAAALRRERRTSWIRFALVPVPAIYLAVAVLATFHHFGGTRLPSDPPYMEVAVALLGIGGAWLVWRNPLPPPSGRDRPVPTWKNVTKGKAVTCNWKAKRWGQLGVFFAILTIAVVLGWWSTEVLYAEQVVYSYSAEGASAGQK